jgi:hypothetical protein
MAEPTTPQQEEEVPPPPAQPQQEEEVPPPPAAQPRLTNGSCAKQSLLAIFDAKSSAWADRTTAHLPKRGFDKDFDELVDSFNITNRQPVSNLYKRWRDGTADAVIIAPNLRTRPHEEVVADLNERCASVDDLVQNTIDSQTFIWSSKQGSLDATEKEVMLKLFDQPSDITMIDIESFVESIIAKEYESKATTNMEVVQNETEYYVTGWLLGALLKEGTRRKQPAMISFAQGNMLLKEAAIAAKLPTNRVDTREVSEGSMVRPSLEFFALIGSIEKVFINTLTTPNLFAFGGQLVIKVLNAIRASPSFTSKLTKMNSCVHFPDGRAARRL